MFSEDGTSTPTAISDAFERASGSSRWFYEISMAARKFIAAGGLREKWIEIFDLNASGKFAMAEMKDGSILATDVDPPKPRAAPRKVDKKKAAAIAGRVIEKALLRFIDSRNTSDGRAWGSVKPYELIGMKRDGALAEAIMRRLGELSAKQQKTELRDLMTDDQFKSVMKSA